MEIAEDPNDVESSSDSWSEVDFYTAVQDWIDSASYIPKGIGYSWSPFCEALIENHLDITGVSEPPPPPGVPDYAKSAVPKKRHDGGQRGSEKQQTGGRSDVLIVNIPADKVPDKDPAKGSWKHVVYVPEWTDPDYKENFMKTPAGRWRKNQVRDAIANLRPALRLEDAIRNPTDYALRFGIADGRRDGRSRMSPTWSQTRDPMEDIANQIDMMNDAERGVAINLSREALEARGEMPTPGQEILPEVVDTMLASNGMLTNAGLKAEVAKAREEGKSLDRLVEELESKYPQLRKTHKVFLDNALDDQDYQRLILSGLTTDEMIQVNAHTMSNDPKCDLDNELFFLFRRERWVDSRWKGSTSENPKLAYNVGGTREEWNIQTNDALWDALQPALRLASIIILQSPPHIQALINMCTRQPIAPQFDRREKANTPTLTKYVLEEDIDLNLTYPAIRTLKALYNFDWREAVLGHLSGFLELDIASGYTLLYRRYAPDIEYQEMEPCSQFAYGSTGMYNEGPKRVIRIKLAAESIWPLLVPQYSASEKMVASFEIANTMVHEFAHAIVQAQIRLCSEEWTHPPQQLPEVKSLCLSLKDIAWDMAVNMGEPFFEDYPEAEVGRQVEESLWGMAGFPLEVVNRHYPGLVLLAHRQSYPYQRAPERSDTVHPNLQYHTTVPLDTIEKFFTKKFWLYEFGSFDPNTNDYSFYGFAALKGKSDRFYSQKILWNFPSQLSQNTLVAFYGYNLAAFLDAVPNILWVSRHRVLSRYLRALTIEVMYEQMKDAWWAWEINHWSSTVMHTMPASVARLFTAFQEARSLSNNAREAFQATGQPAVKYQEFEALFGPNGKVVRCLATACSEMQDDIAYMQLLVFHYPLCRSRGFFLDLMPYSAIDYIYGRLVTFRQAAERIVVEAGDIQRVRPTGRCDGSYWPEWHVRFQNIVGHYQKLVEVIERIYQGDTRPFDAVAKEQFDRLPTAEWRYPSERYRKMAMLEYERAHPAVRDTIDDFIDTIHGVHMDQKSKASIGQVSGALQSLGGIGAKAGQSVGGPFRFQIPNTPPPTVQTPSKATSHEAPSTPPPASIHAIFGVPGGANTMPTTPLEDDAPRRVSPRKEKSAYRKYVTNLLASPDPEHASEAASDLFTSGVPQPLPSLSPRIRQLSQGSGRAQFQVFPNPFANRVVMTSEAQAFQEQRRIAEQANEASGTYTAQSMWREKSHTESDDGMSM
ncbi:hypothetical protein F5B22DRAFT_649606 [Xylaria bambusicola]|uniref:uncharacterized protein n=1 Tax=Xylaria bambusicola TaxID=326684 RepID=UPI0020077C52|nr:uncharacterized protein F5B22DRAFT_649606 [Xylaria bambusicola]KAI0508907.1 hypothetical protein F5B22DRAFT_649606 [Xylaria bambusicola]